MEAVPWHSRIFGESRPHRRQRAKVPLDLDVLLCLELAVGSGTGTVQPTGQDIDPQQFAPAGIPAWSSLSCPGSAEHGVTVQACPGSSAGRGYR